MTDAVISLAAAALLCVVIHRMTRSDPDVMLRSSRRKALRELLTKQNYEATHRYYTPSEAIESEIERARRS